MTSSKGNVVAPLVLRQPEGNLSFFYKSSLIYFLKIKADLEWLYINTGRSQEGTGAVYGILCSIWVCFLKEEKSQYYGIVISKVKLSWYLFFCFTLFVEALVQLHLLNGTVIPNVIPLYPLSSSFYFTAFIVTSTSILGLITPTCPPYEVRSEWQASPFTTDRKTPKKWRKNVAILFL